MHNLNVTKTNVIVTLLKICRCNKSIDNVVVTKEVLQWQKWNVIAMLFTHVIQTYHKKPYLNVVKAMVLEGNWNNVVANQYKEPGQRQSLKIIGEP